MGIVDQRQTIHRRHEKLISRALLDEDPGVITPQLILEDDDEIRCRIHVRSTGMPINVGADTNEVVLVELVNQL